MRRQLLIAFSVKSIGARVVPDVRSVAAVATELYVVDVRRRSILVDQNQLVLGSVERAHAAICLVPHAQRLELRVVSLAGLKDLGQVAPIHAMEVD